MKISVLLLNDAKTTQTSGATTMMPQIARAMCAKPLNSLISRFARPASVVWAFERGGVTVLSELMRFVIVGSRLTARSIRAG
nr:hypothetical protein GCM10020092_083120 [Actinoplanes digitatis]